jgi:hypothetical protein
MPAQIGTLQRLASDDLFAPMTELPSLGGSGPFVINLSSSAVPISLPSNGIAVAANTRVYQIRCMEDRRVRYRLRMGPFSSEAQADAVLKVVRDTYPAALSATATSDDLEALGDLRIEPPKPAAPTAPKAIAPAVPAATIPQLSVTVPVTPKTVPAEPVRKPALQTLAPPAETSSRNQRLVVPTLPASAPASVAAPSLTLQATPRPAVPPVLQMQVFAPAKAAPPQPTVAQIAQNFVAAALAKAPVQPKPLAAPVKPSAAPASPAAKPLPNSSTPASMLTPAPVMRSQQQPFATKQPEAAVVTAQSAKPAVPATASAKMAVSANAPVKEATAAAATDQMRWFVVELSSSDRAFDPDAVPNLDIFSVYRLYSLESIELGSVTHTLRLGFFTEQFAAKAVADYLADHYEAPAVRRVDAAERERFTERPMEARKNVEATGRHAVIEITDERYVRELRLTSV